jgi:hypothetical protein
MKTSNVPMSSSPSKIVSHMWVRVDEGGRLEEVARPGACGKWGSQFSTWVHNGVMFTPGTDGDHSE